MTLPEDGVINLSDARMRARRRAAGAVEASLAAQLEQVRERLDWGQAGEAEARARQLIKATRYDETVLAQARTVLAAALEMQGRNRESLDTLQIYEEPVARAALDADTSVAVRVQLGLAYNYAGDHPKAIALLNATLRESGEGASSAQLGALYAALSRVYRSINEFPIARDNSQRALEHYRNTGDWRGMAEAYFGIALSDTQEGAYEAALENNEQALKLVGDRPAPYLLGRIYANMAGACWFLKRPLDGISHLEKAVDYYERTDHKTNASIGYNNLGINLILVGDWGRAQVMLQRALELATESDERGAKVAMVLDSLGELHMLRGEHTEARTYLERAVQIATENGNKWYAGQALRTLGRVHLAMDKVAEPRDYAEQALTLAERIGDRYGASDARLLLAEAHLRGGDPEQCAAELHKLNEQASDATDDLSIAGDTQRLMGLMALAQGDATLAIHHFGRSISIFSILCDRYRTAVALYNLGRAYAISQPERAAEHYDRALQTFRELGARSDIARVEASRVALEHHLPTERQGASAVAQLLTLRLAEAVASRELLLRELAAALHQETNARRVLIAELDETGAVRLAAAHGLPQHDNAQIAEDLCLAKNESAREQIAQALDAAVVMLRPTNALPALLYVEPRAAATLPGGAPLDSLLRVVELGMNVCALRARVSAGGTTPEQSTYTGSGLMPGFIHSSPAMTKLVEEVHKIRSSDVTVLVTGESGTGKELVARAIHALSSRRSKVFVPFNCTAVPKELSDAYLFGYRRGSFTGAVSDSPGVIR
ncbi:MAG TPA: tetratricopeptide repeat protein, partial [Pyrinomonadaceae bacterium]